MNSEVTGSIVHYSDFILKRQIYVMAMNDGLCNIYVYFYILYIKRTYFRIYLIINNGANFIFERDR